MFYDHDSLYVVDNIISEEDQNFLEDFILKEPKIPFYYNTTTNGTNKNQNPELICNWNTVDLPQFTHNVIWDNEIISDWGEPIVNKFIDIFNEFFNCSDYDIFRCKINLSTSAPRTRRIIEPHVDSRQNLWSIVYFVNTVPDSYFLLGKQTFNGKVQNKFKVAKKVETKKGRAVIFDSRRFHSAGKCPDGYSRSVINFTIGKYEDL